MITFTHDEINLMAIYDAGTREGLIAELFEMRKYLDSEEVELRELTDGVIAKLEAMTDVEFNALDLISDIDFSAVFNGFVGSSHSTTSIPRSFMISA